MIEVLFVIYLLTLFLLGSFFVILIYRFNKSLRAKQKELVQNLFKGQEEERQRLSRDLHDEMAPALSAIIFEIDKIKTTDNEIATNVFNAKSDLKNSVEKIREISHNLTPTHLARYGLIEIIEEQFQKNEKSGIVFTFTNNCEDLRLDHEKEINIYRIIQELSQNSIKHSKASKVALDFHYNPTKKSLLISYSDNGIGIDNNDIKKLKGIGMSNILARIEILKSSLEIKKAEGLSLQFTIGCA